MTQPFRHFQPDEVIHYTEAGSWRAGAYLLDKSCAAALEMALATKRPLLVKGAPGMGKSYLARAAAAKLQRKFIAEVIQQQTHGQDLLWRYDPVARLNEARGSTTEALHPRHYVNPGVLWWAYDWDSAELQYQNVCHYPQSKPHLSHDGSLEHGLVVLIDEIDKADASLPDALLEVLGNGSFEMPILGQTIGKTRTPAPLVIITSNDEKQLPAAFVRRCLVLHLRIVGPLEDWLLQRAALHFGETQCSATVKGLAARQLKIHREQAEQHGGIKAGLAEYLDLLAALDEMTDKNLPAEERERRQCALLDDIQEFVLQKSAPRDCKSP
jgi:MoxR-like ATPase